MTQTALSTAIKTPNPLNYDKARERDKEGLKDVYFEAAKEGICNEMAANAGRGWRPKRRYYK